MNSTVFLTENDDPIDIRIDGAFKAVFTKETPAARGALSRLVSALIGREVAIVTTLANEPPIGNMRDRQLRLDINCRAENGELVNVEMCFNPKPFEPVRLEFHAAKLFSGQDIKGADKDYDDLNQAYQIAILAKKPFFPDEEFFHTFEYYDPVHRVSLKGRSRVITLELDKLETVVAKPVGKMSNPERWAVFFEYLTDRSKRGKINEIVAQEEGIAMASSVLMTVSRDEEERARIMRDEKIELDYQSYMSWAKKEGRKIGLEEGRKEGREEGHEEGRKEGREEGLKAGREEGRKEGREEGIEIGEHRGEQKTQKHILELIAQGLTAEDIKQCLEQNTASAP